MTALDRASITFERPCWSSVTAGEHHFSQKSKHDSAAYAARSWPWQGETGGALSRNTSAADDIQYSQLITWSRPFQFHLVFFSTVLLFLVFYLPSFLVLSWAIELKAATQCSRSLPSLPLTSGPAAPQTATPITTASTRSMVVT